MYVLTEADLSNMKEMLTCPDGFVVRYGGVCEHDMGFMCNHRIDFIEQWIKNRSGMNVESLPIFSNVENLKEAMELKEYGEE